MPRLFAAFFCVSLSSSTNLFNVAGCFESAAALSYACVSKPVMTNGKRSTLDKISA
jgi:hypothetical protein